MIEETIRKQQARARMCLVASARDAKEKGVSQKTWKTSKVIRQYIQKHSLRQDLVEHISAFVWTFKRK